MPSCRITIKRESYYIKPNRIKYELYLKMGILDKFFFIIAQEETFWKINGTIDTVTPGRWV